MNIHEKEFTEDYKSLLNMCDLKTAVDVLIYRADELDDETAGKVADALKDWKGGMKLYVVNTVSPDGYDSWETSYHLTRKGALKMIIQRHYANWELCRYVQPGSYYDELRMFITEKELME